jgi:sugar lactone lactonase YvrE
MRNKWVIFISLGFIFGAGSTYLAGCSKFKYTSSPAFPPPTPTATNSPTPTRSATLSPTPTKSPTPVQSPTPTYVELGVVTTLAGQAGVTGATNGSGLTASFNFPHGIAADSSGNVYVADTNNSLIRKITSGGDVSTLAGSGTQGLNDGTGTTASFDLPKGIAADAFGNVFVADTTDNRIRKIDSGGAVTTLSIVMNWPTGIAVDSSENVYDSESYAIRKITSGGAMVILAGSGNQGSSDGTGIAASFDYPQGVAVDTSGNVYVADTKNNLIRKITPDGTVTTLAGSGSSGHANGTGSSSSFNGPEGVAVDSSGNVYVADTGNEIIRKITSGGIVTVLAGQVGIIGTANGTGSAAKFKFPEGIAVDSADNVYVADYGNQLIRKIQQ